MFDYLPKPIYESLPYLYVAAGWWATGLEYGTFSASLFFLSGFLVGHSRFNYRMT